MGMADRIDVVDLIISVLQEHEGSLNELVERLERLNDDLAQSMNESAFVPKETKSPELLDFKVKELEKKLDKYREILKTILNHCEKINDVVCVKAIAEKALDI